MVIKLLLVALWVVFASGARRHRVEHSLVYDAALSKAKVPVEMHLYAHGGHAFGLRRTDRHGRASVGGDVAGDDRNDSAVIGRCGAAMQSDRHVIVTIAAPIDKLPVLQTSLELLAKGLLWLMRS
jgi:acetyl esterase/lipase